MYKIKKSLNIIGDLILSEKVIDFIFDIFKLHIEVLNYFITNLVSIKMWKCISYYSVILSLIFLLKSVIFDTTLLPLVLCGQSVCSIVITFVFSGQRKIFIITKPDSFIVNNKITNESNNNENNNKYEEIEKILISGGL